MLHRTMISREKTVNIFENDSQPITLSHKKVVVKVVCLW